MLTDRETEIIRHLALLRSRKQIALLMGLTVSTVETHILHACEKAHIQGTDLLAWQRFAISNDIVAREEIVCLYDDAPEPEQHDIVAEIHRLLKKISPR